MHVERENDFLFSIHSAALNAELDNIMGLTLKGCSASIYQLFRNRILCLKDELDYKSSLIISHPEDYDVELGFGTYISRRSTLKLNHLSMKTNKQVRAFVYFIIAFYRIYRLLDEQGKTEFRGKLERGLSSKLLSFQQEIETHVHLYKIGFKDIKWLNTPVSNKSIYDLLVTKKSQQFEVESKTINRDSGLPIIESAANKFFTILASSSFFKELPSACILRIEFKGRLLQDEENSNGITSDKLFELVQENLNNKRHINIERIETPFKVDNDWVQSIVASIRLQYPLSYIIFPITSSSKEIKFIVLNSLDGKNEYLASLERALKKAMYQLTGDYPGVVFLYPEGLTATYLEENKNLLIQKISSLICLHDKPLMICIRSQFKEDLNQEGALLKIQNQPFEQYNNYFEEL